jgi:O-succinylbenzoic acid--CoA ligase
VIAIRGPVLFSGYHPIGAGPSPFDDDGFFDTGDEGHIDAAGRLHVLGRRSDPLVVGGENVRPSEVEDAALALPGIADACAFGVADAEWGERVAMVLVGEGGPPDLDAVAHTLRTRLAAFKVPTRMAVVDGVPYRGIGKRDRRAAAARFADRLRPVAGR